MKVIPMITGNFEANNVFLTTAISEETEVLRLSKDPAIVADDEATYAKLRANEFKNGTIEVKVLSRLLADAPDHARGFIGIAFRVDESDEHFEAIYLRPTNGRCEDQVRRNRSIQYFSYPNYKYDRFRDECPGMYETYVDIALNEWIDIKIEVKEQQAKLYVNHAINPSMIVNDLKLGANVTGGIGLWVDVGTEGFFKELKITTED
ncbi:hypothetical protein ACYSNW_07995 [Enterococcus sp. LJL99]